MGSLTPVSAPPELWLVRHGRTEWAATGRHTGWTDVPLDDVGRAQAESLAPVLRTQSFDRVVTSPLTRAHTTCVLAGFGERADVDDDLREWNYGDYEGRTKTDILRERPSWSLWDHGVPGGERLDEVAERSGRFVTSAQAAGGRTLVFAHGHLLRILTACWLDLAPNAARLFVLEPAATCVLGHEREQAVIRTWNRVADTAAGAH